MESGLSYSLEVNGKGTYNSFNYETMSKANEAYKSLASKFKEHKIMNKHKAGSDEEMVQLTISDLYIGTIPTNTTASIVPEDWFNKEVYDEMLEAARDYYEKSK